MNIQRFCTSSANPLGKLATALVVTVLLAMYCAPVSSAGPAESFETPPVLKAHDLAPDSLLVGKGFRVNENVPTDGLTADFTIQTDLGTLDAHGLEMLKIRVAEIPAMIELSNTSKTGVFAESVATNAARPVVAAGQMVMHPVDTIQGLPGGVSRFFGRVGLGAQKIKEAATEPAGASAGEKAAEAGKRTGQVTRDVFGYEQERRELAKKLNVDPYTSNPILTEQLDDIALTAFRAHVAVTTTMSVLIPGSIAITGTRIVSQWVWDTPRADLILMNEKKLTALKVPQASIDALMKNPSFPLSVLTSLTEDLTELGSVPGVAGAGALAATAESEDQARFLTDAVGMLAKYNQTQTPLAEIIANGTVYARDRAGVLVVPAEVDYVSWTPRMSTFAKRRDLAASKRTVWISGRMSPMAKQNFEALGWVVLENVSL